MVTPETEAKFARRGVTLVQADVGRRFFARELRAGAGSPVELVCGQGPWERTEADLGRFELVESR